MSREDRNVSREAHVVGICLEHDVDWQWAGRRGRAFYARPRKGEGAVVLLPRIRGQMTYAVALHELGHVLSKQNRYLRRVESELDAWQWALDSSEEDFSQATYRGIRRRLSTYIAWALRNERRHLPAEDSEFQQTWETITRGAA